MDMLSLASNIISIVNATATISRHVKWALEIQGIPEEILQFQNEVPLSFILDTRHKPLGFDK